MNGIQNFTGTAEQNTELLNLLKAGKLLNPNSTDLEYYPACGSSYTSLYPALESIGVSCDWDLHCRIAELNGIQNFTGTAEQNTELLNLLKAGKLRNPDASTSSGSGTSSGATGTFINGYDNGYKGGMAGDGKIYAHGLDVSSWQGSALNFQSIKNAGYDYVILRAGTSLGKDSCFETYYTNAKAAGLDVGTYYYTYATSVSAAQTDASNMLSWIKGKTFEYPVYYDYEDSSQDGLSSSTAKNICLTFCDAMAEAGYLTGIYTGYYKSTQLPISSICAKYEIWIANYWDYGYTTLSPSYSSQYGMYQYTDRNYVGSNGPYDGNVAFKDYPAIVQKYGFNGYGNAESYFEQCTVSTAYCKVQATKSSSVNTLPRSTSSSPASQKVLTAEAGDTFTANAIYCNSAGNYWYQLSLDDGTTAYIYSGHCTYVESLDDDISISYEGTPEILLEGDGFEITGEVIASFNTLNSVMVGVYRTDGSLDEPVFSIDVKAKKNSCTLNGAALDFSSLEVGEYVYAITANYSSTYAAAAKEAATHSGTVNLVMAEFVVQPNGPYMERCSFYPAYAQITTTKATSINSMPCAENTNDSVQLLAAVENASFTVVGVCKNPSGKLWYQVKLSSGVLGYLFAGDTSYVDELTFDICLTDVTMPSRLWSGQNFNITGTIGAAYNQLQKVKLTVLKDGVSVVDCVADVTDQLYALANSPLTANLDFASLPIGDYQYEIAVTYQSCYAAAEKELVTNTKTKILKQGDFAIVACEHSYVTQIVKQPTCGAAGILSRVCTNCGVSQQSALVALEHQYAATSVAATCTAAGGVRYTCQNCGDSYMNATITPTGHRYVNGVCSVCGVGTPTTPPSSSVTVPTLTLKSPSLEFKDMIRITAFYTAENTQDVAEMGMITYSTKVATPNIATAEHVIPGATYVESTGRYYSSSQGIHGKYLGDTVYLAVYAKLTNGTYAYSKVAGYSAVQYATSQLKNSTDTKLKQLVVAMLNYGAEAQIYFGHNTTALANASLTADQKALPDAYRSDMVKSVATASSMKQGSFANNSGFSSRKPAISFEGAFCINYFFTPKYLPDNGITLYYWNASSYNRAGVLTTSNATGSLKLTGSGTGEYRGDITGIAAKSLSDAVYVAVVYQSGGTTWTSGVLGYSIGAYCSSQAPKGVTISGLAQATAIYGYYAKQYFG